jgi:hypothetical protein
LDINEARRIFEEPEPFVAEQWLRFLSDEQMGVEDSILARIKSTDDFELHIVFGGAGTGKTQILLLLASELQEAGLTVGYFTTSGVRRLVQRAGLDIPPETSTKGAVHLLDDPLEVGQLIKAIERAESSRARALVVAVDPFQWTERTSFLKLSQILGEFAEVGEIQRQSLEDLRHIRYGMPRNIYYLKTAFRQTREAGIRSLELTDSVFQRMNPYVRPDKQEAFNKITEPFIQRILTDLEHVTPGGSFRVEENVGTQEIWAAIAKVAERRDRWDWTEPVLFVYDGSQLSAQWDMHRVPINGVSDRLGFNPSSTIQDVLLELNARIEKFLHPAGVRGQEFQDVIICLGRQKWSQLSRAKAGLTNDAWKTFMPIHTFTTRAIDSVHIVID